MNEVAMVSLGLSVADRLQLAKFCAALRVPEVLTEPQRPRTAANTAGTARGTRSILVVELLQWTLTATRNAQNLSVCSE